MWDDAGQLATVAAGSFTSVDEGKTFELQIVFGVIVDVHIIDPSSTYLDRNFSISQWHIVVVQ